jgi:hypothetical protein
MTIFPIHVATEGILDAEIGIATRGWIIPEVAPPPVPPVPPVFFIVPIGWIGEFDTATGWIGEYDPDP